MFTTSGDISQTLLHQPISSTRANVWCYTSLIDNYRYRVQFLVYTKNTESQPNLYIRKNSVTGAGLAWDNWYKINISTI